MVCGNSFKNTYFVMVNAFIFSPIFYLACTTHHRLAPRCSRARYCIARRQRIGSAIQPCSCLDSAYPTGWWWWQRRWWWLDRRRWQYWWRRKRCRGGQSRWRLAWGQRIRRLAARQITLLQYGGRQRRLLRDIGTVVERLLPVTRAASAGRGRTRRGPPGLNDIRVRIDILFLHLAGVCRWWEFLIRDLAVFIHPLIKFDRRRHHWQQQ